jgi:ankyrin repeat protein
MRFRLRTLLIVLALGPPLLAGAWVGWQWYSRGPDSLADFDIKTGQWPTTALQLHSYQNNSLGMRKELESGANIDESDSAGRTALHWAVFGNHQQAVWYLLDSGASAAVRDEFGYLPIDYARDRTVRALLETAESTSATVECE